MVHLYLLPLMMLEQLVFNLIRYVTRRWGVTAELENMKDELLMIKNVLHDAEEKQIQNNAIGLWLNMLKHVAYDLEDLLDEFATESLPRQVEAEAARTANTNVKVRIVPSCFRPAVVLFKINMASKLKKITETLERIAKERNTFGLSSSTEGGGVGGYSSNNAAVIRPPRPPTTSLVNKSSVYGRGEEKEELIKLLRSNDQPSPRGNDGEICVISIVGMGGVGKTTLAQVLYNHGTIDTLFDLKAWAYVSDEFDLVRVTKAILESAATNNKSAVLGSTTNMLHHVQELDPLQVKLKDLLSGKKFLLVLDDVWSINYSDWHTLTKPLTAGASGSKIIVTTRIKQTSLMRMHTGGTFYYLMQLKDEDCWSLFKDHALGSIGTNAYPELEDIRKQIVEKCQGLPLAAMALGGLLCSVDVNEWKEVLKGEIRDLPAGIFDILPALRLSYYHLPAHLKQCFAYCAIIPKGFCFQHKLLIHLWIAEGFVKPEQNKKIEDVSLGYFHDLLSRSLFQESSSPGFYIMPDLIIDLAKFISGEICFYMDDLKPNQLIEISKKARYLSYGREFCDIRPKFDAVCKAKRLRTFIQLREGIATSYLARQAPNDLVASLKYLRVLDLSYYFITKLSNSIGRLTHLRYLDLSGTAVKRLPDSICTLYNLQFLYLKGCWSLTELPKDMANLINLRSLVNSKCFGLKKMPIGMVRLRNLRILSYFVVGKDGGSSIRDLKDMDLEGYICLSKLENVTYVRDAHMANLRNKLDLVVLELIWSERNRVEDSSRDHEKDVLDSLQPHKKLEELYIKCYNGIEFSRWVGHSSYRQLRILQLSNCRECESLPPLGQLPSLNDLAIVGLHRVKSVGPEFYGVDFHKPFQSLEKLTFTDMQEWEEWFGVEEELPCFRVLRIERCSKLRSLHCFSTCLDELKIIDCEELTEFPRLSSILLKNSLNLKRKASLVISNCPKLTAFPMRYLPLLHKVAISDCSYEIIMLKIDEVIEISSSITSFHMSGIPMLTCLPSWFLQCSTTLEELYIDGCDYLMDLLGDEGLQHLTSLRVLKIFGCSRLMSLSKDEGLPPNLRELEIKDCAKLEKLPNGLHNLDFLRKLEIINCPALTSSPEGLLCGNSLEDLKIEKCSSLTTITIKRGAGIELASSIVTAIVATSSNTSQLESLVIYDCENLESLPEGLNNLKSLDIRFCPRIVYFPEGGLPSNLRSLLIVECGNLCLPDRFHNIPSLRTLVIQNPPMPFSEQWLPTNLKKLWLTDCENIGYLSELYGLTSLESLSIGGFPSLKSFPVGMFPTSLRALEIRCCPNLKYLPKELLYNPTSLEALIVRECPKLTYLPKKGFPTSKLRILGIFYCPQLKRRCQKKKGKEWSKISHIPLVGFDDKRDLIYRHFLNTWWQYDSEMHG